MQNFCWILRLLPRSVVTVASAHHVVLTSYLHSKSRGNIEVPPPICQLFRVIGDSNAQHSVSLKLCTSISTELIDFFRCWYPGSQTTILPLKLLTVTSLFRAFPVLERSGPKRSVESVHDILFSKKHSNKQWKRKRTVLSGTDIRENDRQLPLIGNHTRPKPKEIENIDFPTRVTVMIYWI